MRDVSQGKRNYDQPLSVFRPNIKPYEHSRQFSHQIENYQESPVTSIPNLGFSLVTSKPTKVLNSIKTTTSLKLVNTTPHTTSTPLSVTKEPTLVEETTNLDFKMTTETNENPTTTNHIQSLGTTAINSATNIDAEALLAVEIEKFRIRNLEYQQIQLDQLAAAKKQLDLQIEDQKKLQLRW